jgi:cytochrome bd-type quinol oxidase subunit 2
MNQLLQALQNLRRAPDDWSLEDYAPHAWRITRNVWLLILGCCVVLGAALPPHNPAKMFDEYRPFTIYTVILLGICGFVCAQCAQLAANGGRAAWVLMAIGFFYLMLDDLTQIHEGLDKL